MKNKYIKNGEIYDSVSFIELNDRTIFNPSEEEILLAGYEIYIEPKQEITLQEAIDKKIEEIDIYDSSKEVNLFYYNGKEFWIDTATRVGLKNSTLDEIDYGRTSTTLILGQHVITIQCQNLLKLLTKLEVYAKDCYNVTAQHKINVSNLSSIEDVEHYDYSVGYPDKLYLTTI